MLVLLVVLALVPTWSEGLLLNKCELKSKLEAAMSKLLEEKSGDNIAKVVCTVEQTSGFNTSLVTITDQFNPRSPEEFSSGIGELPLKSKDTNIVSNVAMTEKPLIPQRGEDNPISGQAKVQPEKGVVHVDGQARKQREAPSKDERDGSWKSIESSGKGSKPDRNGLDEIVVPQIFPDPTDIYGDTYEMLFGPSIVPSDRTGEPEDIHYDTYEMIFGARPKAMNPLDRNLDTTEPLGSKQSSEDQTTLYGIFQLSDMVCNSESSHGLANLCGLDCSALIDDDISDDIACLMSMHEKWWMMFTQECESEEPSHYFAECG
ncbi:uncharacterized protein wu:fj19g03 [Hemibagrus wyckioides]|uniref:uncharacterized protein wu:fj19g03 n=1 Tax=Hemibagrus wyckioides TaxID=337641 RepID=UPI00266BD5B7|nr:uncharacterized protein wu:fj19g03 [Hemibagrus wyckioides]